MSNSIILQDDINDRCLWSMHTSKKKYTFNIAYHFLLLANQQNIADDNHVFWHRDVPMKVNLFVWCLLRKHLAKKDNLTNRVVIPATAQSCMKNCGNLENAA